MHKLIEVTVACHFCHKHRVSRAVDNEDLDIDQLIADTVAQLQINGQCPHDKGQLEISTTETREKKSRKKVRYV